jgi:3-dehydroquinate synthase
MRRVRVPLGERSYEILVGEDLLKGIGARCKKLKLGRRCVIVTDTNVGRLFGKAVTKSLSAAGFEVGSFEFQAGEKSKNLRTMEQCYNAFAEHRLERGSFVVALGGGVVGDLAGFAAASYLRGIDFVQIPTTLLAQVDSSVGGKTGVNLRAGKNLVGAFFQPKLVLCDQETLRTLPKREYRSGLAEVIKYGIIYDSKLFRRIESKISEILKLDPQTLSALVARCCAIKALVVEEDEQESGLRAILNFGHTIGHAIEAITSYGTYLHGEAISIGQIAAARLSKDQLGLSEAELQRIQEVFEAVGLPIKISLNQSQKRRLLEAMKLDKKVSDGEVKFVLADKIGHVVWGEFVGNDRIISSIDA